jgi:hypothetical protein
MQTEMGFVPQYTAEAALREFASQQRLRRYLPEAMTRAYEADRLRDTLERRDRARSKNGSGPRALKAARSKITSKSRTASKARRPKTTRAGRTSPAMAVVSDSGVEEAHHHD